jgi:4-coumarate--CoA ligase
MAQTIFIAGALTRAIPVYIMKKFDFVQMLENVQKYRISTLTMVPPIVVVRPPVPLPSSKSID